jgi:hypothetical protein
MSNDTAAALTGIIISGTVVVMSVVRLRALLKDYRERDQTDD